MLETERLAVIETMFSCERASAQALAPAMGELHFDNRAIVVHQGDVVRHCWLVVEGIAQARALTPDGQGTLLTSYGPGEIFGSYPEPAPLRTDIIAQGNLFLFCMETAALVKLSRNHADIASGLSMLFARQLDMVLDRMAARTTLSANGRIYAELLRLAGPANRIAPPPVLAALALTVHTTRETASRAIASLVRRGIVRRCDDALEIVAPRLLAELVV